MAEIKIIVNKETKQITDMEIPKGMNPLDIAMIFNSCALTILMDTKKAAAKAASNIFVPKKPAVVPAIN